MAEEDRLPRVPPKSPAEAMSSFKVADGFRIEQVAAEPLVLDPVAMAFDEWGRLYVVEMCDYSEQDKERLGRVRLLMDNDGDGKFDASTVFSQRLSWPTAVACYDGGVFIGAPPDLYYCKDTDGDGVSDEQQLVVTGFGRTNVQGLMNSLQWGLDNRIYGQTSSSNAELISPSRAGEKVELHGRDFAFDPRTREFTVTTGGGQHGMSFNRWGDRFVCSNSNHLQAIVFEERYLARNPFQAAPAARRSITADGPQAEVYRASPVEAWRIARTKMRMEGRAKGPIEGGGRAAGYFTSATGLTIYEGDLWPDEYRGWALVADVGSNLIHRKRLVPDGVTFHGERVDSESEFLTSTDIWFRPVQMAIGPEGALYVADMYREVIEHPLSLPPELKSQIDLTSGRDRGRIYRIVPAGGKPSPATPLANASTNNLVAALDHPNLWRRATAARLLYERQDAQAVELLGQLIARSGRPESRIAALYALNALAALQPADLLSAMNDAHAQVRRHAIRLSEPRLAESPELRQRLMSLAADTDVGVRFQVALSLGELAGSEGAATIANLMIAGAASPDIVGAALTSIRSCAGPVLRDLVAHDEWLQSPAARPLVAAIVNQIERQQQDDDLAILLELIAPSGAPSLSAAASMVLGALGRPNSPAVSPQLAALQQAQLTAGRALVDAAQNTLDGETATVDQRVTAVRALGLDSFDAQRDRLAELLSPAQATAVQAAVIETLASQQSPEVARLVLDAWHQFTPELRRQAVELISQREAWLIELLAAIGSGDIQKADIDLNYWTAWNSHPSQAVRKRGAELRENSASGDRRAVFQDYRSVLETAGDPARGKEVFTKNCASCHRFDSTGHELGPNLAAMNNRGPESILYNIVLPNAEVESRYVNYMVTTVDGRVLTGIVVSETAGSVTLRAANNEEHSILRVDIDDLQSTGVSLMPDGLEQVIDKTAMADLLAFLNQVTTISAGPKP